MPRSFRDCLHNTPLSWYHCKPPVRGVCRNPKIVQKSGNYILYAVNPKIVQKSRNNLLKTSFREVSAYFREVGAYFRGVSAYFRRVSTYFRGS